MMNEFPCATIVDYHGNKHFSALTGNGRKVGAAANDRQVKLLLKYNGFNKVSTRISTRLES